MKNSLRRIRQKRHPFFDNYGELRFSEIIRHALEFIRFRISFQIQQLYLN